MPKICANARPSLGNASFAIDVRDGRQGSIAACHLALAPSSVLIDRCLLLLLAPIFSLDAVLIDASGAGRQPLPNDPQLIGAQLFAQSFEMDFGGSLLGLATLATAC